jgi:hypothetical protein
VRWPRFRLRTLLIAVAVMAGALVGSMEAMRTLQRRREALNLWARYYAGAANTCRAWLAEPERSRAVDYCDRLRLKYEHAAARPWLPVAPDPPPPD